MKPGENKKSLMYYLLKWRMTRNKKLNSAEYYQTCALIFNCILINLGVLGLAWLVTVGGDETQANPAQQVVAHQPQGRAYIDYDNDGRIDDIMDLVVDTTARSAAGDTLSYQIKPSKKVINGHLGQDLLKQSQVNDFGNKINQQKQR